MDEKKAIDLLRKYSKDEKIFGLVYVHSKKVQEIALRIARKAKKNYPKLDINFIKTASLLHDIGRFDCPPDKGSIRHGIRGAEILRKEKIKKEKAGNENLEKYARVAERHLGAGISKQDIKKQKLDLPLKDYIPKTKEEKIITHADNLTFGAREGTINEVYERYKKEVGKECVEKIKKINDEIEKWTKGREKK